MSLIVLCFLHSTSVLSFYKDVVLTLSIDSIVPDKTLEVMWVCLHQELLVCSRDVYLSKTILT